MILVTGGARSGKSAFAQRLAEQMGGQVVYCATATVTDEEMKHRVEVHRKARPASWLTVEKPLLSAKDLCLLDSKERTIIIDCLATLTSNLLLPETGINGSLVTGEVLSGQLVERISSKVLGALEALVDKAAQVSGQVIIVTNEVGWGLVPGTPLGRLFRDLLGRANQMAAARASKVYLLVAGIPVRIK
ncbi:MAG: bifunctional adenosylcobinamide kinase/adenosylcobinamide-phosphate guanylyltransferase [Bacillota bacterium]